LQTTAEQTLRPESIALGVFGLIAALAMLVIAGQVISRRLRFNAADLTVIRALGATPTTTAVDGLVGIVMSVVAGSLLAGFVAVALSPLGLLGPIRPYIPNGVNVDWTVVGLGVARGNGGPVDPRHRFRTAGHTPAKRPLVPTRQRFAGRVRREWPPTRACRSRR
jgi:hypothetical protein